MVKNILGFPGIESTRLEGVIYYAPTPTVLTDGTGTRLRRDLLYKLLAVGLLPILALPMLGCSSSNAEPPAHKAAQSSTLPQQLRDIDNNPNMPPAAKSAAKAALIGNQKVDLGIGRKPGP
jgi:hypothetical protein